MSIFDEINILQTERCLSKTSVASPLSVCMPAYCSHSHTLFSSEFEKFHVILQFYSTKKTHTQTQQQPELVLTFMWCSKFFKCSLVASRFAHMIVVKL